MSDETSKPVWLRWHDVGLLNEKKKYEEALRAGKDLMEKFPHERVEGAWSTLAMSFEGLGRVREAEEALVEGARRYPRSALFQFMIGDLLARTSTGDALRRQNAILSWRNALQLQAIEDSPHSTFSYLKDEIDILAKLPLDRAYPPLFPKVTAVLDQLQRCGLFEARAVEDVAKELADQDPAIVRPAADGSINIPDLLQADSRRYLFVDWRFSAEEVLKQACGQAHEPALQVASVSDTYRWMGYRTVSFKINGTDAKKTVSGASGLIRLLNVHLRKLGQARLYWQGWKWTFESCCHFLLLSDEETQRLRASKLIPISRC